MLQNTHVIAMPQTGPTPAAPSGHSWQGLMAMALDEAQKAMKAGEVPVGAVIVSSTGDILSTAHNKCISMHDPTAHAEILALRAAGLSLNNYRLNDAILVVTLEPCLMCAGAMVHSRLGGLVYGAADRKAGAITSCCEGLEYGFLNHKIWHMGGVCSTECADILKKFFTLSR